MAETGKLRPNRLPAHPAFPGGLLGGTWRSLSQRWDLLLLVRAARLSRPEEEVLVSRHRHRLFHAVVHTCVPNSTATCRHRPRLSRSGAVRWGHATASSSPCRCCVHIAGFLRSFCSLTPFIALRQSVLRHRDCSQRPANPQQRLGQRVVGPAAGDYRRSQVFRAFFPPGSCRSCRMLCGAACETSAFVSRRLGATHSDQGPMLVRIMLFGCMICWDHRSSGLSTTWPTTQKSRTRRERNTTSSVKYHTRHDHLNHLIFCRTDSNPSASILAIRSCRDLRP